MAFNNAKCKAIDLGTKNRNLCYYVGCHQVTTRELCGAKMIWSRNRQMRFQNVSGSISVVCEAVPDLSFGGTTILWCSSRDHYFPGIVPCGQRWFLAARFCSLGPSHSSNTSPESWTPLNSTGLMLGPRASNTHFHHSGGLHPAQASHSLWT